MLSTQLASSHLYIKRFPDNNLNSFQPTWKVYRLIEMCSDRKKEPFIQYQLKLLIPELNEDLTQNWYYRYLKYYSNNNCVGGGALHQGVHAKHLNCRPTVESTPCGFSWNIKDLLSLKHWQTYNFIIIIINIKPRRHINSL